MPAVQGQRVPNQQRPLRQSSSRVTLGRSVSAAVTSPLIMASTVTASSAGVTDSVSRSASVSAAPASSSTAPGPQSFRQEGWGLLGRRKDASSRTASAESAAVGGAATASQQGTELGAEAEGKGLSEHAGGRAGRVSFAVEVSAAETHRGGSNAEHELGQE